MSNKIQYTYDEYSEDIKTLIDTLEFKYKFNKIHLVSLYRGSLGICAHLSNALDLPLSIIDFQSRDIKGESIKEPQLIKNAGIQSSDTIIIIDDILDTGLTLDVSIDYLTSLFPMNKILFYALHYNTKKNYKEVGKYKNRVSTLRDTSGEWIEYFWEKKPE